MASVAESSPRHARMPPSKAVLESVGRLMQPVIVPDM